MATAILRLVWKVDFPIKEDYFLTFDDGPSDLTKDLIKVLRDNEKNAIFFLLGQKLGSYDLSMYEGYQIACHGYRHVNFALMDPYRTYLEFNKAIKAFEKAGIKPKYFRAPYGLYNLTLLYLIKKSNMKPFQWDYLLGDWNLEEDNILYKKIKEKANNKHVLVLHDGTEGSAAMKAKEKMLEELTRFLNDERKSKENNY
ncbi:MAG: polysaccharide deacetylase family protein [Anaerococcus sp.]|nr:polysaccharide deacetylase family protein [Anaerococcus sp.]